eukprot:jgi/Chlat1/8339/Chrsp8S08096
MGGVGADGAWVAQFPGSMDEASQLDATVEDLARIRIAIIPVGEFPTQLYDQYATAIRAVTELQLKDVHPFHTDSIQSPFARLSWSTGWLHCRYVEGTQPSGLSAVLPLELPRTGSGSKLSGYSSSGNLASPTGGSGSSAASSPTGPPTSSGFADVGRTSSRTGEDLQMHRKVLGVIGICHCPTTEDVIEASRTFRIMCKAFSSALAIRCFGFSASSEQMRLEDRKKRNLVLFGQQEPEELQKHIVTLVQDFAALLIMEFEKLGAVLSQLAQAEMAQMHSQQAGMESLAINRIVEENRRSQRQRIARSQKSVADYAMLAGSPADARVFYAASAEMARNSGDTAWWAASIEGSACAAVIGRDRVPKAELEQTKADLQEAIALYKKIGVPLLELEATLRLAKLLIQQKLLKKEVDAYGLRANALLLLARTHNVVVISAQAANLLMNAVVDVGVALPESGRLALALEAARLFGHMGFHRKKVFFLRWASKVATMWERKRTDEGARHALQLLMATEPHYYQQFTPHDDWGKGHRLVSRQSRWASLQLTVLGEILDLSVQSNNSLGAWTAAAQLLRDHYDKIPVDGQQALATDLVCAARRMPPGTSCQVAALPLVRLNAYPPPPRHMVAIKRVEKTRKGPFIYSPFENRPGKGAEVFWVAGEVAEVTVELCNLCTFEVVVDALYLKVDRSSEFEALPLATRVPPNTPSLTLTLACIPRTPGPLIVQGCVVQSFGMLSEHRFDTASKGPTTAVTVVPPLPLVFAGVYSDNAGKKRVKLDEGRASLALYPGECRSMYLELRNLGIVAMTEAVVVVAQQLCTLKVINDALQFALPLEPRHGVMVPFKLIAAPPSVPIKEAAAAAVATLNVDYSGLTSADDSSGQYGRRQTLDFDVVQKEGLHVQDVTILPYQPGMLRRSHDGTRRVWMTVSHELHAAGLTLKDLELSTDVDETSLFVVEVDIENKSNFPFRLAAGTVDDVESHAPTDAWCPVETQQQLIVMVVARRFHVELAEPNTSDPARAPNAPVRGSDGAVLTGAAAQEELMRQCYAAALSEQIAIMWRCDDGQCGTLPCLVLAYQELNATTLAIVQPDPISFRFLLDTTERISSGTSNGAVDIEASNNTQSSTCSTGSLATVTMCIRNKSKQSQQVLLSVRCEDDSAAECLSPEQEKTLWAGCLTDVEIQVSSEGDASHAFALCFLQPGKYYITPEWSRVKELDSDDHVYKFPGRRLKGQRFGIDVT